MSSQPPTNGKHRLDFSGTGPSLRLSSTPSPPYSPVGPLIGREHELAELTRCLADGGCRLISVVGLGGAGKTRVAWELAGRMASRFMHGAVFVSLAPLESPDLIVPTLAASLGLVLHGSQSPMDQLLDFLSTRELLLVLDNFEHLLPGADLVAAMLRTCPNVRLLITSRERLNLREEWVFDLTGLDVPLDAAEPAAAQYDAVQLFVTCARRARADFRLAAENLSEVIRICRLVEGLPLGIELAAAWVRTLSCRAIGDEIAHSLDLLATHTRDWPEKHRSLRAVFDQSWKLLAPTERGALASLTVFRGGFSREAAQAVAGADLAALASLLDKALLHASADDRYDLHMLVQQYAAEQLEVASAEDRAREAHGAYFAAFVADRVPDLKGRRQLEALREIAVEFENVRTAWNWAVQRRSLARLDQVMDAIWLFGALRSREPECEALLADALPALSDQSGEAARQLWGRLVSRATPIPSSETEAQLREALRIAQRHDDQANIAHCLYRLGANAYAAGDFGSSETLLEQSLAAYHRLGDPYFVAHALFGLSMMGHQLSWERMSALRDESLRLRAEIGDRVGMSMSLSSKALAAARMGRYTEAERLWRQRIALAEEAGNLASLSLGYAHLSYQVYFVRGDFAAARAATEEALRLGEAHGLSDTLGWSQVTLGALACMEEDYWAGMALCQQGASAGFLVEVAEYAAWGMCLAAWGLGDLATMREQLPAALRYSAKLRGEVGELLCLPIAARLLAEQGDMARAVEWLALAFTHPYQAAGWMEKWPLLTRWRAELEAALGADAYQAAWLRGAGLDLAAVIADVSEWLVSGAQPVRPASHPALAEPLTARELEVLRLIARGLSNPAIARELVISVGTVKAHSSSIYGKLGVRTRIQAVEQARALGLL